MPNQKTQLIVKDNLTIVSELIHQFADAFRSGRKGFYSEAPQAKVDKWEVSHIKDRFKSAYLIALKISPVDLEPQVPILDEITVVKGIVKFLKKAEDIESARDDIKAILRPMVLWVYSESDISEEEVLNRIGKWETGIRTFAGEELWPLVAPDVIRETKTTIFDRFRRR